MEAVFKLESMEVRRLLSAAVADAVLQVNGTGGADKIAISLDGDLTRVIINDDTMSFNRSDFNKIEVQAGDGDDVIGLDNDSLKVAAINGGEGDNTLDFSSQSAPMMIDADESMQWQNVGTLKAGDLDDHIEVFSQFDTGVKVIDAGGGDDYVMLYRTAEGATVYGGDGDDTLQLSNPGHEAAYYGGAGNDTFETYRSSNTGRDFHGGAGTDTVDYSPFNTGTLLLTLDNEGGDGVQDGWYDRRDNVHTDIEVIIGTPLDDTITGSTGNETIRGGDGDDLINGNGGDDSLDGGAGQNTIITGNSDDLMDDQPTDQNNNQTASNDSEDKSSGSDNSDSSGAPSAAPAPVVGTLSHGVLRINGTRKADRVSIHLSNDDSNLLAVTMNGVTSTYTLNSVSQVQLSGGAGNDRIVFGSIKLATRINGGDGNDTIYGDAGNDRIVGGNGNDYINSGSGNDVVYGDAGNDRLFGGAGKDYLYAGSGRDVLRGGNGKDSLMVRTPKRVDLRDNKGDRIILTLV